MGQIQSSLSWFITRELSSRTREVKHPILSDPGEILPKINPKCLWNGPSSNRLCWNNTDCSVPKHAVALQWPSAAPLQGAHTALVLPAGEGVSCSIMAAWRVHWRSTYTCNLLINAHFKCNYNMFVCKEMWKKLVKCLLSKPIIVKLLQSIHC